MCAKPNKKYTVPSVDKAIDVLMLLSENPNLSLNQVVETLGFSMSTCYNILNTLQNRGLVEKDSLTARYSLGLTLMRLGMEIYEKIDIRIIAHPVMKDLVNKFGETSYLSSIDKSTYEGVVLDKIESLKTVTVVRSIGSRVPLYASATGKSLLSGLSPAELEEYLQTVSFYKYTENTITQAEELKNELEKIKQQGYAITEDEMGDGASSVSVPINDYQGNVIAAMSVAGPIDRMKNLIPQIIPEVKVSAERISELLRR
ncbi:IclR family transcriptional regulator [Evansella halocellulosilytica]|uniref:IclR family transcriptional regulator n=1 Tax=Evansella halocellulosilytica TaxID=2011013 RepID=UPI000BB9B21E|nr:IclR family transcriptional regulator [Evansella halocellulosilytica]